MTKRNLLIIGAGSVGGFIAYNFDHLNESYHLLGFLDDDPSKVGKHFYGVPVLGTVDQLSEYPDAVVIIGIAFPKIKRAIVERLQRVREVEYINYISPYAWISKGVTMGNGVIIYPGATIDFEVEIADFVTINKNCSVGHNIVLGEFATLSPMVALAGFTFVASGVEMGISSCTRQRVRIAQDAVVGGNTMLIADVPARAIVVGSPGRVIGHKE